MYEIIEKNQYGVKVKNTTGYWDCNLCKHDKKSCEVDISQCNIKQYYLPDSEAEKLESEKPTINGTTPDVVNLNSDTQKELIDLRVELRVEKDKSKALDEYSRGLELKVKEFECTIENNVTEVSEFFNDGVEIFECNSCGMLMEENEPYNNYCPNCGRKIKK